MTGLLWYRARTHDMPTMIRYPEHWATAALKFNVANSCKLHNISRTVISILMPFEQWMSNTNMPIKVWNVYGQCHRTISVEGWNSKMESLVETSLMSTY
ncbi:hypothetical protein TNCV_2974101 [Trichonephila clavipes]|nr:hypothetical protein TNCV_2974101 [Trichonephila clavipes]